VVEYGMGQGYISSGGRNLLRRHILLVGVMALACSRPAHGQSEAEILIAAMQDGGKVIYLRHAATNQNEIDTGRLGDRAGQRNLSPAGIQQARELGRAFRALLIPLEDILASPVFRARDTAELAFSADRITVTMDLVADEYAGGQLRTMLAATARLLRTPPRPGTNRLLIGHRTPLEMVTRLPFSDTVLPEGAMAVFLPGGDEPRLLGTVSAQRLTQSAEVRRAR
jgi:phosphohistidine phosphatase SixA